MGTNNIIKRIEDVNSDFDGTVIDIETIGKFDDKYQYTNDSREYQYIQQIIFGFINKHSLHILCAKGMEAISDLGAETLKFIDSLQRPFYAFNCNFERGVWFHQLGKKVDFDGELQAERESKAKAVRDLGIPNYDDPFYDRGLWCMNAWHNGEFDAAIAHNRACLLKERDILIKRNFRKPDELKFIK
ncbi:MAG: hypothetical protein A2Z76_00060 [Chloroflexi bacterium RBG_13_56_8b]|nr:MAG: hypothetical protein A2Z76_00060 [Chloroflexi bacterium RBG_13_56_8b]